MKSTGQVFYTDQIEHNLRSNTIRGGLITTLATLISYTLRAVSIVIFARILIPEYFGLVGMVTAIIAFGERFKDLGLSLATVQTKEISHKQLSSLFWINTFLGMLIMLIVCGLSWPIAWLYQEPRLFNISLALSINFLIGGLTVQHQALLRRQMLFARLAWIQIVSNLLSIAIGIVLAINGFNYWSLVWKEVSRGISLAVGTWLMCPWRPSFAKGSSGLSQMLRFGMDVTAFDLVYYTSRSLDQILLGKSFGPVAVGYYRQAYQLMALPLELLRFPLIYVGEAALSRLQNDPCRYNSYYQEIILLIASISMPLAIYFCFFSDEVVVFLFGDKWLKSAEIFRILSFSLFTQPFINTFGLIMVTSGKSKRYFWWGVLNALFLILGFLIGIEWGPTGVALGYTLSMGIICTLTFTFFLFDTPINIITILKAMYLPGLASLGLVLFLHLSPYHLLWFSRGSGLFSSAALTMLFYLAVWCLIPGGKIKLFSYFNYIISAFRANRHALTGTTN